MSRLFVAVWPPADVLERLAALPRPDEPGVRWVDPAGWHVTLRFLGDADAGECAAALSGIEAPASAPMARLGPAVSRLGRSVLCVPCAGLDRLAEVVVEATASLGRPPDPRPFAGHLTLARLGARGSCGLAGHRFEASFPVADITLVASEPRPGGSRYEILDRIPLG
jgi:2'-5' RNA ligase